MANPIFYLILGIFCFGLSLIPPFLKNSLTLIYIFHAFVQIFASGFFLFWIDSMIHKKQTRSIFAVFAFFLFLLEFTHLTLARLMDSTIRYLFEFLFGGGISNLIPAWQSLNFNIWMVAMIVTILSLIPFFALLLYRLSNLGYKLSSRFAFFYFSIGICLSLALPSLANSTKSLPWGNTAYPIQLKKVIIPSLLKPHRSEAEVIKILSNKNIRAEKKPNIYLFIIETFRKDFITSETAPKIVEFGSNFIYPKTTHSNANYTFLSWFSILHSNFPHHWIYTRNEWQKGSLPLNIFKQLGYELFVYSSADLKYFGMDELLFGKQRRLANKIFEPKFKQPWENDAACIDQFAKTVKKEGGVHLFFLDSPHSEYSVPPHFPKVFGPVPDKIDYLTINPKNTEPLKNRYKNSICYIDSLFERFLTILKTNELFDEAIIALTGDHGEEFFEDGSLFHGTHLNEPQTNVPIIYKLPFFKDKPFASNTTHIDILPTILHGLTNVDDFSDLFDGQSLFLEKRRPFRLCVHHSCSNPPTEFLIEENELQLHFQIKNVENKDKTTTLELISGSLFDEISIKDLFQTNSSSN